MATGCSCSRYSLGYVGLHETYCSSTMLHITNISCSTTLVMMAFLKGAFGQSGRSMTTSFSETKTFFFFFILVFTSSLHKTGQEIVLTHCLTLVFHLVFCCHIFGVLSPEEISILLLILLFVYHLERLWSDKEATSSTNTTSAALQRLEYFRCLLTRRGVPAAPVTNFYARRPPLGPGSCYEQ